MCFSKPFKLCIIVIIPALALAACARGLPLESDPYATTTFKSTVISDQIDLAGIQRQTSDAVENISTLQARNNFISLKMYLIDKAYFDYERKLTNEDLSINTLGSIGTLASTAVAAAIPAGQATKVLAAAATGLNGATSIYDEKVLRTKTIQALQVQMRANRDAQAALIYARTNCPLDIYRLGMALSDLEAYAHAGTFEAALQGLDRSVAQAQETASDAKNIAISHGKTKIQLENSAKSLAEETLKTGIGCPY